MIFSLLLMLSLTCVAPNIEHMIIIKEEPILDPKVVKRNNELDKFIKSIGFIESSNDWTSINDYNCFGEFNFSYPTLKSLGYEHITPEEFKNNPMIFPKELQYEVMKKLIKRNEKLLHDYMIYIGCTIDSIKITKAGMIAGSHLGGAGSVQKYLSSNGTINATDMYGTKVSDYIKRFSSYNF